MTSVVSSLLSNQATQRNPAQWEERFKHWERPASDTEEDQIQRAARMVMQTLNRDPWFSQHGIEVRPQGSYHNNTNVRKESDMDLCVWSPSIRVLPEPTLTYAEAWSGFSYTETGRTIYESASQLRRKIGEALVAEFGNTNVRPGKKAFRLSAVPGSRADADVVPAMRLDYVVRGGTLLVPYRRYEGIVIHGTDGRETYNFPRQHSENGVSKNNSTMRRYKRTVRILKRLRDELVSLGGLADAVVPSFLIECLVYCIDDYHFHFEETRYARTVRVLAQIYGLLNVPNWPDQAREINGIKLLFSDAQPWTLQDAQAFTLMAYSRLTE